MATLHIRVPCSSANLGPGFDTLAVALDFYNEFQITINGDSKITLEPNQGLDKNMMDLCLEMFDAVVAKFKTNTGLTGPGFHVHMKSNVPIARGLGSSGTMRLAILFALNAMTQARINNQTLVKWAAELEGCTDNVAASCFGGLAASGIVHDDLVCYQFDVPEDLFFVAVYPSNSVETDKARDLFPEKIERQDAIFNLNRGILLTMAMAAGDYKHLGYLFEDRIHQPYRQANIPALHPLYEVIEAAQKKGAFGGYLSGSGSTMMAVTLVNADEVAKAMVETFNQHGMKAESRIMKADNQGLTLSV